ncbi:zinc finger protein 541 [Harpia harpyja]|uniref:zinc finger protein 541 n=1 Tax=Harpia harpyja TaxID=202280 RepID=UPI0022B10D84|nr:zinc finger protein 541 [Harpia harpyja]
MDQYPFSDENAVHLEMHLPGFSESQGLVCSKALNHNLCLNAKDGMYAGLSSLDVVPGLPAADAASHALEANLNVFSLYPVKDCDSVQLLDEPDLRPSQHEPGLPVLTAPEEADLQGEESVPSALLRPRCQAAAAAGRCSAVPALSANTA